MSVEIEVDAEAAERLLGRKLNGIDRFLGVARDKAVRLVETELRRRVQPPKLAQNIQDAPRPTRPRGNPVRSRLDGSDGIVSLHPHVTSARTPVLQALFTQVGLQDQLVRKGLWMDPTQFERDEKGRFQGRLRNHGYKSRSGLTFYSFFKRVEQPSGLAKFKGRNRKVLMSRSLLDWAGRADKGTQRLRHTVRITSSKVLIKLLMAPTVKFCRQRILNLFEAATKQAMDA